MGKSLRDQLRESLDVANSVAESLGRDRDVLAEEVATLKAENTELRATLRDACEPITQPTSERYRLRADHSVTLIAFKCESNPDKMVIKGPGRLLDKWLFDFLFEPGKAEENNQTPYYLVDQWREQVMSGTTAEGIMTVTCFLSWLRSNGHLK
jgi:hypothetical protein